MTIDPICYVCGREQRCIDGLCSECHMAEFFNPGAAFAATFGSLPPMATAARERLASIDDDSKEHDELIDRRSELRAEIADAEMELEQLKRQLSHVEGQIEATNE